MKDTRFKNRLLRGTGLGIGLAALVLASGCYSKVVDSKGIGGDSTELRKNHEFGSENPVQEVLTRENNRR